MNRNYLDASNINKFIIYLISSPYTVSVSITDVVHCILQFDHQRYRTTEQWRNMTASTDATERLCLKHNLHHNIMELAFDCIVYIIKLTILFWQLTKQNLVRTS